MRIECVRVAMLLKHRERGLSEADRLMLEEHIAHCDTCRRDSLAIDRLGDLIEAGSTAPLSSGARERSIARAIQGAAREQAPSVHSSGVMVRVALAFGAVGLVVALVWGSRRTRDTAHRSTTVTPAATAEAAPIEDRVVDGDVKAGDRPLKPGDAVPATTALFLTGGTTLALGHARIAAD